MWRPCYLIGEITSKSALLLFNLLISCPQPHPHTTHTTTPPPPSQIYPPLYTILLSFSLYFYGIRQYLLQILILSAHGGATALKVFSTRRYFVHILIVSAHGAAISLNRISLGNCFWFLSDFIIFMCSCS